MDYLANQRSRHFICLALLMAAVLTGCGKSASDSSSSGSAGESGRPRASSPTLMLTSDEIEAALDSAGLVRDCSDWALHEPGEVDQTGTIDGVRNCYMVGTPGSVTWYAYQDEADFSSDPAKCLTIEQFEQSSELDGIDLSEFGIDSLLGSNFILTAYADEEVTLSNGFTLNRRPFTEAEWGTIQDALGGGQLIRLDEFEC